MNWRFWLTICLGVDAVLVGAIPPLDMWTVINWLNAAFMFFLAWGIYLNNTRTLRAGKEG